MLTLKSAALFAIALLLLCVRGAMASDAAGPPAYLSEVLWAGSDLSTADEWLEIAKNGTGSLDLSGWSLTVLNGSGIESVVHVFGTGTTIGSGGHLVLARQTAAVSRLLDEPDVLVPGLVLPNTKLLIRLKDAAGALVDQADDGVGNPMAGSNTAPKASMERLLPLLSGADASAWKTAERSAGFDAEAILLGTPGEPREVQTTAPDAVPDPLEVQAYGMETASGVTIALRWSSPGTAIDGYAVSVLPSAVPFLTLPSSATGATFVVPSSAIPLHLLVQSFRTIEGYSNGIEVLIESYIEEENSSTNSDQSEENSSTGTTLFVPSIRISEVAIGATAAQSWVELVNSAASGAQLDGWSLSDGVSTLLVSGAFPSLGPGQRMVISVGSLLKRSGGMLYLLLGEQLVHSVHYPSLQTGTSISFPEEGAGSGTLLCAPTPAQSNNDAWTIRIDIQSGSPRGIAKTSLNAQIVADGIAPSSCTVDFGDGGTSNSCNPPSHTYEPGTYVYQATAANICGVSVIKTLEIVVEEQASSVAATPQPQLPSVISAASSSRSSMAVPVLTASGFVLSRAMPNPAGVDTGAEWIEITNVRSHPQVLDGWVLRASRSLTLTGSLRGSQTLRYILPRTFVLKNSSGSVTLLNPAGIVVSRLAWTDAKDNDTYPLDTGTDLIENKNVDYNFGSTATQTGSVFSRIRISELRSIPEKGGEEWIELENTSENDVTIAGSLDDMREEGSRPWKFDDLTIPAWGYVLLPGSQTKLQLNDGGDEVHLLDVQGREVTGVAFGKIPLGTSYARRSDGGFCVTLKPTPGAQNICDVPVIKSSKSASSKKTTAAKKRTVVRAVVQQTSAKSSVSPTNALLAALMHNEEENPTGTPASDGGGIGVGWLVLMLVLGVLGGMSGSALLHILFQVWPGLGLALQKTVKSGGEAA